MTLYGALPIEPKWPAAWHTHPFTGYEFADSHWSRLAEGDPARGDVKDIWEIGRLTWLGPLLRSAASGDDEAAAACWQHIASFDEHNLPYRGPQWMCGQETALRAILVSCVASALRHHSTGTSDRLSLAARLAAKSIGRIRATIGYALSQRNNHAISEAAFLWSARHLFEGLPEAEKISGEGERALVEAVSDQFYEDGSYAQHSPTYQRLALHTLLWVLAVSRAARVEPPRGVVEQVEKSYVFLLSLMDRTTGRMPNLGGNDGALLFALTDAPIGDFRPVLAHAAAAIGAGVPSWLASTEPAWFGLAPPKTGEVRAPAPTISSHVVRGPTSHAVFRAGPLRHRPAHADQLHVDIWIGGVNVAADAGSYRYTSTPPWQNALAAEEVHNVLRLVGHPQAVRRGRFLWTRWREAAVVTRAAIDGAEAILAELALPSGVVLRRLVVRRRDVYAVIDGGHSEASARWNFPAGAAVERSEGKTTVAGDGWHALLMHRGVADQRKPVTADPSSGWVSPTYGQRTPCCALVVAADERGVISSVLGPRHAALSAPPATLLEVRNREELVRALHEWVERYDNA